jgi:hypothetical protein
VDPAITPERRERVRDLVVRYRRTERLIRAGVIAALTAVTVALAVLTNLLVAGGAFLAILVALRAPLVNPGGTTVAVTDADPEAVRDVVAGPYPPMLALVWGRGEEVTATPTGGRCEWSLFGGLRSATVTWDAEPVDGGRRVTYRVDGTPVATYDVTVTHESGETVVEIDAGYARRVGLRVLPSFLAASRYRDAVWAAQGYELRERDWSLA